MNKGIVMKQVFVVLFLSIGLSAEASSLQFLKKQPATKYDLGKFQMQLFSLFLSDKLEGKSVKSTKFEFFGFEVVENDSTLTLQMNVKARAKYLQKEYCSDLLGHAERIFSKEELIRDVWPDLSPDQYNSLQESVNVQVQMVSEENTSFKVDCV